jgi:hypothetical protein
MNILFSGIKLLIIGFVFIFSINHASGQDSFNDFASSMVPSSDDDGETFDLTGWRFGINMGMYFANKETAGFYSGIPTNENSIAYVLNNKYWGEEIKQQLNSHQILKNVAQYPEWQGSYSEWQRQYGISGSDTSQWWIYYPEGLKYDAAISPGFYAKYNFNNSTGVFLQSNYVKLKTSGIFQMAIDSINYLSEPALRAGYLRGIEERVNIDLGISKFYQVSEITHVFVEMGMHINSTRVLENRIRIGNKEYTIVDRYLGGNYVPNGNTQEYQIYQGGIGFGIFLAGGLKFIVTEDISIDPGVQFYWKKLNLNGYNDFSMDTYAYLRLIFNLFQ